AQPRSTELSGSAAIHLIKSAENALMFFGRNSNPLIAYTDLQHGGTGVHNRNFDARPRIAEFDGVVNQGFKHFGNLDPINRYQRQIRLGTQNYANINGLSFPTERTCRQ